MFTKSLVTTLASAATVVALGSTVPSASANMILNGDFSANASKYTTYPGYDSTSPNPSNPTGWVVSVPANAGVNGPDTGFFGTQGEPFAPASTTGVRDFAFMQGGQIFQTVTTTAGQAYQVTYDAGARGNTPSTMNTVAWDNVNHAAIVTQSPGLSEANFTSFTMDFTAASSSTQIVFEDTGGTPDVSNVSLTPVPEPASLGLVAVGGLGMLLIGRKRAAGRSA